MLNKTIAALSTALMVGVFSINSTYAQTTTVVGAIPGEFDVSGGSATYSIPISVAPGRGGMQPELSLNYMSGGGNGVLGIAWGLSGLSAIHRCPSTISQDGSKAGIYFDERDNYCLNGQRLVPVSGSNGGVGTEYRTEIDSYSQILSVGGSIYNPDHFIVRNKAGHVVTYGGAGNASQAYSEGTLTWSVREVNDTTGNNSVTYNYFIDQNVQYLDDITYAGGRVDIEYESGRPDQSLAFFLGNNITTSLRVNKIVSYSLGAHFQEVRVGYQQTGNNQLSKIDSIFVCDNQNNCFKENTFTWEFNDSGLFNGVLTSAPTTSGAYRAAGWSFAGFYDVNGDGLVDALWKYNSISASSNNGVRVAVSLSQGNGTFGNMITSVPASSGIYGNYGWAFASFSDVNGDGLVDAIWRSNTSISTRIAVSLSQGDGTFGDLSTSVIDSAGAYASSDWSFSGFYDVNEDGFADAIWQYGSSSSNGARVAVALSQGNGTFGNMIASTPSASGVYGSNGWSFAGFYDTNGDGLVDAVWKYDSSSSAGNRVVVSLSQGDGTFGSVITSTPTSTGVYGDNGWSFAGFYDANGDGLEDAVWKYDSSSSIGNRIVVSLSLGDGTFGPVIASTPAASGVYGANGWSFSGFYDANGDGLEDAIWKYDSSSSAGNRVVVSLSQGNGTFGPVITSTPAASGVYGANGWSFTGFIDASGDGLVDAVWKYDSSSSAGNRVVISRSQGDGTFGPVITSAPATSGVYGANGWMFAGFQDVNGNGFVDAIWKYDHSSSSGTRLVVSPSNAQPLQLTQIIDSNDTVTQLSYKTLLDPSVYTKGSGAQYPVVDLIYPRYVVSQVETSDGVGGTTSVQYHYESLRTHVRDRGSYGFGKITETYPSTGKTMVMTYDQSQFPYVGSLLSVVESYNGNKVNESINTFIHEQINGYQVVCRGSGCVGYTTGDYVRLHPDQSIQSSYELGNDTQPVTTITTTYENIDNYGNVGRVTTATTGAGQTFTKIAVSNYGATDNDRKLGRLSDTTVTHQSPYGTDDIRRSAFTYYPNTSLLETQSITDVSGTPLTTTTYTYDAYGQKTEVRLSAAGEQDRVTTTVYDNTGRPTQACNAYNQCETYTYTLEGWLDTTTGPNGITTDIDYDSFGRQNRENRADGTWSTSTSYFATSGQCGELVSFAYTCSISQSSGSQPIITQYDTLGREVRTIKTGFDGRLVYSDTEYNHLAQVSRASRDYYSGDHIYWATSEYDPLGRVTRMAEPGPHGSTKEITYQYNGLTTTTMAGPEARSKTVVNNAIGQKVRVEEEEGTYITYTYNSDGNLLTTTVNDNPDTVITLSYDEFGRKITMDDPDMGYWTYDYNAFGELVSQTDAITRAANTATGSNDVTVSMEYDLLGRMVSRTEAEGISTWVYGDNTAPAGSIGKLLQKSGNGLTKDFSYDNLGRADSTTTTITGEGGFTSEVQYDSLGRVSRTTYPGTQGFYTENVYNANGFLEAVTGLRTQVEAHDYTALSPLITQATTLADDYLTKANQLRSLGGYYQSRIDNYESLLANQTIHIEQGSTVGLEQNRAYDYLSSPTESGAQSTVSYIRVPDTFVPITGDILVPVILPAEYHYRLTAQTTNGVTTESIAQITVAEFEAIESSLTDSGDHIYVLDSNTITCACDSVGHDQYIANLQSQQALLSQTINEGQALSPEFLNHLNNTLIELQNVQALISQQAQSYATTAEQLVILAEQTLATADHSFQFVTTLDNAAAAYSDFVAEGGTNTITYWRAVDVDASGRISAEVYGNGIVNDYAYNQGTGELQSIHSSLLVVDAIRHLEYQYDTYNNVTVRDDLVNDIRDTYEYDRLDRLTANHVSSTLYQGVEFNNTQSQSYDVLGNIDNKSDVGAYSYGSRPHAVTQAGNNSYIYDANGNMTSGDGRTIQYSSFNKPTQISRNGQSATFSYGPSRARYRKVNHNGDTTLYLGGYERTTRNNGAQVEQKHYIYAAGQLVAEHIISTTDGTQMRYLHKDALGSVDLVTDAYGAVVDRRSFDAWGKMRNLPWKANATLDDPLYLTQLPFTDKGYTGHEHVQEVELIHMNGRMYDATLARFISADPHIQAGAMSQSYNRYSYVLNSPLKYTDPSGYFFKKKIKRHKKRQRKLRNHRTRNIKMVKNGLRALQDHFGFGGSHVLMLSGDVHFAALVSHEVKKNSQHEDFAKYAPMVAGVISYFVCGSFCSVAISSMATADITYYRTGSWSEATKVGAESAAIGFAVAGASSYIGSTNWVGGASGSYGNLLARSVLHGVVGGTVSVIRGGKFGEGFASSFFTKLASPIISSAFQTSPALGVAVAAIVGGTASELGGGKFANGAYTAMIQYMFNEIGDYLKQMATNGETVCSTDRCVTYGTQTIYRRVEGGSSEIQWESISEDDWNSFIGAGPGIPLTDISVGIDIQVAVQNGRNTYEYQRVLQYYQATVENLTVVDKTVFAEQNIGSTVMRHSTSDGMVYRRSRFRLCSTVAVLGGCSQ